MVRIYSFLIFFILSGCANPKIVYGKETDAPWGWTNTYCPDHPNEAGCK